MNKILTIAFFLVLSHTISAQEETGNSQQIEWLSFTEAVEANKTEPKKFLIDVYTSWCGWCKKMDNTTFKDPEVVAYVKEHYHAVKLNAERKDTVYLNEQIFS